MFEPMKRLLESKGYRILSQKRGKERGPDITAERQGRRLIMEMKGAIVQLLMSTSEQEYSSYSDIFAQIRIKSMRWEYQKPMSNWPVKWNIL